MYELGEKVLLTDDSEWYEQNKREGDNGEEYAVVGTIVGRCHQGEIEGKYSKHFKHFQYSVLWEDETQDELYYRDIDLMLAEAPPVTNQEAKKRLSKEW
jgi:hypothetical protein